MAFYILRPDGSKRGPFTSEWEAEVSMGEEASICRVVEEAEPSIFWKVTGAIFGAIYKIVTRREYGKSQ